MRTTVAFLFLIGVVLVSAVDHLDDSEPDSKVVQWNWRIWKSDAWKPTMTEKEIVPLGEIDSSDTTEAPIPEDWQDELKSVMKSTLEGLYQFLNQMEKEGKVAKEEIEEEYIDADMLVENLDKGFEDLLKDWDTLERPTSDENDMTANAAGKRGRVSGFRMMGGLRRGGRVSAVRAGGLVAPLRRSLVSPLYRGGLVTGGNYAGYRSGYIHQPRIQPYMRNTAAWAPYIRSQGYVRTMPLAHRLGYWRTLPYVHTLPATYRNNWYRLPLQTRSYWRTLPLHKRPAYFNSFVQPYFAKHVQPFVRW